MAVGAPGQLYITVDTRAALTALKALDDRASASVLSTAARAGGGVVAAEWRALFRRKSDASFPGSLPRRQTGTYSRSITVVTVQSSRSSALVHVGPTISNPPYPIYLEFGTSRMPPHPIARPAAMRSSARAQATSISALKTLLRI